MSYKQLLCLCTILLFNWGLQAKPGVIIYPELETPKVDETSQPTSTNQTSSPRQNLPGQATQQSESAESNQSTPPVRSVRDEKPRPPQQLVVSLDEEQSPEDFIKSFTRRTGAQISLVRESTAGHVFRVQAGEENERLSSDDIEQAAQSLGQEVVEDKPVFARFASNDPLAKKMWNLDVIKLQGAWDLGAEGEGIIVAVPDTGVPEFNNEDLDSKLIAGYDFTNRDYLPFDNGWEYTTKKTVVNGETKYETVKDYSLWHGKHVVGTIAAIANNGKGIAGVAPKAKVLVYKVLPSRYSSDVVDALRHAVGMKVPGIGNAKMTAQVVNLSLGLIDKGACPKMYQDAINDLAEKNVAVVVAAGNNRTSNKTGQTGWNVRDYAPGNCEKAITVAATDPNNELASYSYYGEHVVIAAPGGDLSQASDASTDITVRKGIPPTFSNHSKNNPSGVHSLSNADFGNPRSLETTFQMTGTSMAAPHVTGVIALMLSVNKDLTYDQIRSILISTASDFPSNVSHPDRRCTKNAALDSGNGLLSDSEVSGVKYCGAGVLNAEEAVKAAISGAF